LRSIDALGKVTTFTYDNGGNQLSVRDPNSVGQDVVYDALGRAGLTTDTLSHTSNSGYDRAGNRITSTDGKSQNTTYVFDARGRQKSQTDRLSGVTQFTYTPTGQLATLTDAENQTTTYTYDDRGAKLTEQYPDHTGGSPGNANYGIVTFIMDAAGRVARKQDQQGDTCTFKYDLAGRMYQRDYRTAANSPTGTIADSDVFTFDKASRMLTAISGRYSNTVTQVYDPVGRKASESLTIAGQTYTTGLGYGQRGELSKYTYPDGTVVDRLYTARGELHQVKHNTTVMDTRAYDDGGRMNSSTLGNGVVETRGYNSDNTLSTISFGGNGTAIGNLTYTWDSNKNKTSETIGGVMSPYSFTQVGTTYDAEDRLTGFARAATSGTPQLSQSWNLSAVGDWNSVTTNGTAQSRTHGPTHELVTAGGQSVTHDTKGNMLLIPASVRANSSPLVLTWDFDNRMVCADVGADSVIDVTHQYDALGRRVARTASGSTTVFVQVDQQTICDYASGAAPASSTYRYLYGSYIDEPIVRIATSNSETTWYHRNQQYSIVACTDSTGAATERYAYSAYGLPTITDGSGTVRTSSAIGNRYTYTGREWDGVLGLYHYRARMYEATVGRFCSRDPIGYLDANASLYTYANSSPVRLYDPLGLEPPPFDPDGTGATIDDYIDWWFEQTIFPSHPGMSDNAKKGLKERFKKLLSAGCIGVVGTQLGFPDHLWTQNLTCCYKSFEAAKKKADEMTEANQCCEANGKGQNVYGGKARAQVIWVQFSNDSETKIEEKNGCFDLSTDAVWREINSHVNLDKRNANFDFKIWVEQFQIWLGANHGAKGMKVLICKNLKDEIKKGEENGLELNFYCPACEKIAQRTRNNAPQPNQ
jgi:RHS repeat-associated protein